jgi:hypothetical protein
MISRIRAHALALPALVFIAAALMPRPADAQERHYHPFYLPAEHNWQFRAHYPAVDRLVNAFDFGHGILYEELYTRPDAPVERLERTIYERLTRQILRNPPRMPMPEEAFMPRYARFVPLAKQMFEWSHMLHRQVYDVLADPGVQDRDAALEEVYQYYITSRLAFTDVPKSMAIMDEQYFSQEFRQRYPRFNGLIWAYHWLQIAIHEPFMHTDDPEELQAAMMAIKARFWQMVADPPDALPVEMPMMPAIAPEFSRRYPRVAAIFDNLHMMHDVISDILVSDLVEDRRREIYRQADLFRDPGYDAMTDPAWFEMAIAHGVDAQGGPAFGFLPPAPTLGVEPHDAHAHHAHPPDHEMPDHEMPRGEMDPAEMRRAMAFFVRLFEDPQVERRLHADHARHTLWEDPAVQRHLAMMHEAVRTGEMPDHEAMDRDGMHRTMELFARMLADPLVEARIHAVPELHHMWEDPAVQRHIQMVQEMSHRHGMSPHGTPDHDMRHRDEMPDHEMPRGEMDPAEMRRAMAFFVRLLEDPQVERRLHADHARHALWEDPAVQRHLAMMREAVRTGEMPDHEAMDRDGMHRTMELFARMLADPQVEARIHAVPELHHMWEDPAVQRHIQMMREMHGTPGAHDGRHDH